MEWLQLTGLNDSLAVLAVVVVLSIVLRYVQHSDQSWRDFMSTRDDAWRKVIHEHEERQYKMLAQLSQNVSNVSMLIVYHHAAVTQGKEVTSDDILDFMTQTQRAMAAAGAAPN